MVKNAPDNVEDTGNNRSVPGFEKALTAGNGNLLQYSFLENPMHREARRATVHRVAERLT